MDGVALGEGEAVTQHMRRLVGEALKINLDPPAFGIPDRIMSEAGKIERAAELAIDARKKVEVESRGHAARVVVGRKQNRRRLLEIDAEQERASFAQESRGCP